MTLASLDIDEDTWDANAALNLKSFYLVTRAALPLLLQRQTSAIVNVTSVNGLSGIGEHAYSAQKAGVINLTENLAVKYGAKGLRVNCVAPGTPVTRGRQQLQARQVRSGPPYGTSGSETTPKRSTTWPSTTRLDAWANRRRCSSHDRQPIYR
jgi:NAD(P)-dependent dehydrogenase (short-subunit alcohol dehydrogenase family)